MNLSVKENSHLTIKEFVPTSFGAKLVYPHGVPETLPAPKWSVDDTGEMSDCQRLFFLRYCNQVPQILIREFLNNDCISFMTDGEEALWLPVWMCGSFFAIEVLDDQNENSIWWTQCTLERCLVANNVTISLDAIDYFVKVACDPIEYEPELYAKLEHYREGLKQ